MLGHASCLHAISDQSTGAEGVVGPGAVLGSNPAPAPSNEAEEEPDVEVTGATGATSGTAGLERASATTLSTPATWRMSDVNSAT